MASKKRPSKDVETKEEKSLKAELLTQLVTLSTSGFGLVAALAWNQAIQDFVKEFIQPYVPNEAIYYKFVYAILITIFAVIITYQLSRLAARFQVEAHKK
jgi:hypothetical protein